MNKEKLNRNIHHLNMCDDSLHRSANKLGRCATKCYIPLIHHTLLATKCTEENDNILCVWNIHSGLAYDESVLSGKHWKCESHRFTEMPFATIWITNESKRIEHLASHIRFACSIRRLINDISRSNLSTIAEKNKVSMKIPLQSLLCLEYTERKSEKMGNISGKTCMHVSAYDSDYNKICRVWLLTSDILRDQLSCSSEWWKDRFHSVLPTDWAWYIPLEFLKSSRAEKKTKKVHVK